MILDWYIFSSLNAFRLCRRHLKMNLLFARNPREVVLILKYWLIEAKCGIRWPEDYLSGGPECDSEEYLAWPERVSLRE